MTSELTNSIVPVIETFDRLSIPYAIGGSVASSSLGIARSTMDTDIVAQVEESHVEAILEALKNRYYVDASAVREAIHNQGCFNLIHLESMLKVDVFILKTRFYDRQSMERREMRTLSEEPTQEKVFMVSAEDIILNKLEWYRAGSEVSERQWNDVIGVLRVQQDALDREYLVKWSSELDVEDLLRKALDQVKNQDGKQ